MKISRLPPAAIDRLVAVDQHAQAQARIAAVDESVVAGARSIMNGHSKADPASILRARAEFPQTLSRAQASRTRADAAQRVASACKAYVDMLPDAAEVEEVSAPQPNGLDLAGVRAKAAELRAEIARVRNLPAPSDRALVEGFIDELRAPAEAQIKAMISRWPHFTAPESLRMGNDSDADLALMTAMCSRDAMVGYLCARIDAVADAAMSPSERPARIAELEAELISLQALEVYFVDKSISEGNLGVCHSPETRADVVLGVVERETTTRFVKAVRHAPS